MRAARVNIIFIVSLLLISALSLIFIPKSISGFYQAQLLQNINLDHFEGESLGFGKSLIAYLALMKILHAILGSDIVVTTQYSGLASALCLFCAYALLFNIFPGSKPVKIIVALGFCLLSGPGMLSGYVGSYATFLSIMIFSLIINERIGYKKRLILVIIVWTCLGLFWHSMYALTYVLVTALLLCYVVPKVIRTKKIPTSFHFFALFTITFIFTWFIFKESTITQIFDSWDFELSLSIITSKGSFTEEFSYFTPGYVKYIDTARYFGYSVVYAIMAIVSVRYTILAYRKEVIPLQYTIITILLVTDIIYISLYFVATGIIAPRIISTLSIPLIIVFLISNSTTAPLSLSLVTRSVILILIIVPLILTSFFLTIQYSNNSPLYNIPSDSYDNNYLWFVEHFDSNQVVSDVHTGGQYQIFSQVRYFKYEDKNIGVDLIDLRPDSYKDIMYQRYRNPQGSVLLINKILFDKHLVFGSLRGWDKYEPIDPKIVSQNRNLQLIYNDDKILFYT